MRLRFVVPVLSAAALVCSCMHGQFGRNIAFAGGGLAPLSPAMQHAPYSLIQVQTTVQTLGNGVQIRHHTEIHQMRDGAGRTRLERYEERNGEMRLSNINIYDAPGKRNITLFPVVKVAQVYRSSESRPMIQPKQVEEAFNKAMEAETADRPTQTETKITHEKLEPMQIAGERAEGTRTVVVIPVGEIGNDAEIRTVSESWYSTRLGMPLRIVTDDPRMGHSVQEVTELHLEAPDPALFQPPVDTALLISRSCLKLTNRCPRPQNKG